MLKEVPRTSMTGLELLGFLPLFASPHLRCASAGETAGDGATCTLNGCFRLRATSKYTSPVTETLLSLPINTTGYFNDDSAFNQTLVPSDKTIFAILLPRVQSKYYIAPLPVHL